MEPNSDPVYQVTTEGDCEGRSPRITLGFARGDAAAIEAFYDARKEWQVYLTRIDIPTITRATLPTSILAKLDKKAALAKEKTELEGRIATIKNELLATVPAIQVVSPTALLVPKPDCDAIQARLAAMYAQETR